MVFDCSIIVWVSLSASFVVFADYLMCDMTRMSIDREDRKGFEVFIFAL